MSTTTPLEDFETILDLADSELTRHVNNASNYWIKKGESVDRAYRIRAILEEEERRGSYNAQCDKALRDAFAKTRPIP